MIAALVLLAQATAAPQPPAAASGQGTVVVTARPRAAAEQAWRDCLARKCPPDQDIDATLAYGDALFIDGDYETSRRVLSAGVDRNRRHAKVYPVKVARLYNDLSRMSGLLGFADDARIARLGGLDAVKAGLPDDDPRVLMQRLLVADTFAHEGRTTAAEQMYLAVRDRARRGGVGEIEGWAMLKTAVLYINLAATDPAYDQRAQRAIADIANAGGAQLEGFRRLAPYLSARLDLRSGKPARVAAAITALGRQPASEQVTLLYAPPIDLGMAGTRHAGENDSERPPILNYDLRNQWADIGFWVGPDGTVRDVEVLRRGKDADDRWIKPVEKALAARRYRPLALAADDPGIFRVERYSLVSDIGTQTGSRIPSRSSVPRVEMTDLSTTEPR